MKLPVQKTEIYVVHADMTEKHGASHPLEMAYHVLHVTDAVHPNSVSDLT